MGSEIIYRGLAGGKAFLLLLQAPPWDVTMKPGPSSFLPVHYRQPGTQLEGPLDIKSPKHQLFTRCLPGTVMVLLCLRTLFDFDCTTFIHLGEPTPPGRAVWKVISSGRAARKPRARLRGPPSVSTWPLATDLGEITLNAEPQLPQP